MRFNRAPNNLMPKLTLWVLLAVLLLAGLVFVEPAEGTFFVLGEACLVGLNGVIAVASTQLARFGIEESLEVVRDFCRNLVYYSVEGFVGRGIETGLRDLVRFAANPNIVNRLPEFAERITDLANQITQATGR